MAAEKLRTGVVGAGVFGAFHAVKHAASPRAELVGVHDIDQRRAAALADRTDTRAFAEFAALLDVVDAVVIATPAATHHSLARAALAAGRHVYVEKPLALSLRDADELIALAAEKALVLQVGHQERFVLDAIGLPNGKSPQKLEFARSGPPSGRGEDVSVVFDLMIHDLDIARHFGFLRPLKVDACGGPHETIATLTFEGGRQCSFIASRRADKRRRALKASFDDGVIDIDFGARALSNTTPRAFSADGAFADPLGVSVDAFLASALDGAATKIDGKAGRGALEWAILIEEARDALNRTAPVRKSA